jgi:cbb3-type cytochrome oxidase maturation protein
MAGFVPSPVRSAIAAPCGRAAYIVVSFRAVSLGLLIALSLALGLAAWLFFLWTVRSGQYDDPEGPKYRMLDEDDESPPGGPGPRGK